MADTYVPKEGEYTDVKEVVIEKVTEERTGYTLHQIDGEIAVIDSFIASLQAQITEKQAERKKLTDLRDVIEAEAAKVALKQEEGEVAP